MNEDERALQALAGRLCPYVGDEAFVYRDDAPGVLARVVVTSVSHDGNSVAVRLTERSAPHPLLPTTGESVLWRHGDDGAGLYRDKPKGRQCYYSVPFSRRRA